MTSRACPMCGGTQLRLHFRYDSQPPLETKFPLAEGERYWRELHRCGACGHFLERCELDQSALYEGEYASSTYGGQDGIRRAFERIIALPTDKSDNAGRASFILEYCRRYWPAGRFAGRVPRLLDVGAGLGVFPHRMKQSGWQCTALEVDGRYVAHHRSVVGIDSEVADVRAARGLGRFDLITFNKVLEHLADPIEALGGAAALLDSDALVYVELPDGEAAEDEGKEREEFLLGHVHVFSFASFALLISHAGFRLLDCQRLREPSGKFTLRGFARL